MKKTLSKFYPQNILENVLAIKNRIAVSSFSAILLLTGIFSAKTVHAQKVGTFGRFTIPEYCNKTECGWKELVAMGNEVLKFAIYLAIVGSTVVFVWAGFKMLMAQGSSGEVEKAKGMMWTAVKGVIITLCAYLIVKFILDKLGVQTNFRYFVQ